MHKQELIFLCIFAKDFPVFFHYRKKSRTISLLLA